MRTDLVMCASKRIPNRYLLAHATAKAIRAFHQLNARIAETTNDVLQQFGIKNTANILSTQSEVTPTLA